MRLMNPNTGVVHECGPDHERTGQAICGAQGPFVSPHKLAGQASQCPTCVGEAVEEEGETATVPTSEARIDDLEHEPLTQLEGTPPDEEPLGKSDAGAEETHGR